MVVAAAAKESHRVDEKRLALRTVREMEAVVILVVAVVLELVSC
jgi:hypothetical protein